MSTLRANVADLAASGTAVTGHGETLATAHAATDGRIASAAAGWQGASAAALAAKAAAWTTTSSAMLTRLSDRPGPAHRRRRLRRGGAAQFDGHAAGRRPR
jgi:uncharacterized protein YukE